MKLIMSFSHLNNFYNAINDKLKMKRILNKYNLIYFSLFILL